MKTRKHMVGFALLGLLVAGALLVAACGSDDGGSGDQPATQAIAQPTTTATVETTSSTSIEATTGADAGSTNGIEKLNLNTATGAEFLALIPDFPNNMVREFLEYRPYVSIQQFRREIGKYVSDEQVAEWEQYVYVPVAVDDSDAETLKQLPGVTDAIAEALIAGRPYGSNDAFLTALAGYVTDADVVAAAAMLDQ